MPLRSLERVLRRAACAAMLSTSLSCTAAGVASPIHVLVPVPQGADTRFEVRSVALQPSVPARPLSDRSPFSWGEYAAEDAEVLLGSMRASAAEFARPPALQLDVVLRSVHVAQSDEGAVAVACAAFALTSGAGELVYSEQFYASSYAARWSNLGEAKDELHATLALKILELAALYSAPGAERKAPRPLQGSYKTLEGALQNLPETVAAELRRLRPLPPFDWPSYLARLRR